MRIILSPAKKMRCDPDTLPAEGLPVYLSRTRELLSWIRGMKPKEQKTLWACSEKIAEENRERFAGMDLERNLTPAVLSFDGIQYQYMAPAVLEEDALRWLSSHVRILSGFYGVLKPMDGVAPYRLEMQAKGAPAPHQNLYDFWGDSLYREVTDGDHVILNLASKEYSKCIEPYLTPSDTFITCVFGEMEKGKIVQKGVYAKMDRGSMVRFLAGKGAASPEEAKDFDWGGCRFHEDLSDERTYVFLRDPGWNQN
jgi:cytoplasmic iron level regulating protein YaaA (DUF328/UPF0246 family)